MSGPQISKRDCDRKQQQQQQLLYTFTFTILQKNIRINRRTEKQCRFELNLENEATRKFSSQRPLSNCIVWAWDIDSMQKINASFQNIAQTENKMSVV